MNQDIPDARHTMMDDRIVLAQEFFEATGAELIPFVSDEATWFDFDYLDVDELARAVESHYGVGLSDDQLSRPFWALLDFLDSNRTSQAL